MLRSSKPKKTSGSKTPATDLRKFRARLRCEPLETRLAPATINWDGGAGGTGTDWLTAANWVGDVLPGASDDAVIGGGFSAVTINVNGTVTINKLTSSATVQISGGTFSPATASTSAKFTMAGGTLDGAGDLSVSGVFSWTGGTMQGAGKTSLTAAATGTISGATNKFLGRVLENSGALSYTGSGINYGPFSGSVGVINNLSGAVFNSTGDGDFAQFFSSASHAFNNSGTFNRSGAGTTTFTGIAFNNTGTVNVTAGTLELNNGGTDTGAFAVSSGTTLKFGGGTHSLNAASSITGAGTAEFSGGTTTVSGTYTVPITRVTGGTAIINPNFSATTLEVSAGTLDGTGNATVSSTFTWTGGIVQGTGKTTVSGPATGTISTASNKFLGRVLENAGTVNYTGSSFLFGPFSGSIGIVNNLAGGVFNSTGDGDFNQFFGSASHAFNNSGTFNRSGAGTTTFFNGITFNNSATVNLSAGTFQLSGPGTHTGLFATSAGTVLHFDQNTNVMSAGSSITGSGTTRLASGTLTANANLSLVNFDQQGGTLNGSGTVTVTSAFTWSAGTMDATGQTNIAASASATISGVSNKFLGRMLQNATTMNYTGSSFFFGPQPASAGTLNNLVGAVFNATGDGDITEFWGNAAHAINNSGTFNRSGAGTTRVGFIQFNNTGTTNVTAGKLELDGGGTDTGPFTVSGGATLDFSLGTHSLSAASTITGAGTGEFSGGTTTLNGSYTVPITRITGGVAVINVNFSPTTLEITNGTLDGTGNATVTSTFTWSSGIMLGSGKTVVTAAATGTLSSANNKFLGRIFENSGNLSYTGASFLFGPTPTAAGTLNNLAGGVLNMVDDGDIEPFWGNASHVINNSGTMNRSGAGTTRITAIGFNNSAAVNITAGTLELGNATGGTDTGTFAVSPGTVLLFNAGGGVHTMAVGSSITGGGTTRLGSGTLAANANLSLVNFDQQGGTLNGSGTVTVTTLLSWSGGIMDVTGQTNIAASATGTISGANAKFLGRVLQNAGSLTYDGSNFNFGPQPTSPGTLNNMPGATFDIAGDGAIVPFWGNSAHAINNNGVFKKSAGLGNTIDIPFHHTGSAEITAGSVYLDEGGSFGGSFNMVFGALTLTGGTFTVLNGTAGTGIGVLALTGATMTINTGESGSIARLTQRRGTINGGGTLTLTNNFSFAGGVQSGTGKTVVAAGVNGSIPADSPKFLARTLENHGTLTYSGTNLSFGIGGAVGTLNNMAGAVLNLNGDGDVALFTGGAHAINNAGTLNRLGAGTTAIAAGISLTNTGTANINAGTLSVGNAFAQTSGITNLTAGTTLASATGVNIDGGILSGIGTISGNLTNKGVVRPGGVGTAGTITVTGNYTQTATGSLDIELGGTGAGAFDVLAIGGLATLAGTLNVTLINGFNPANGNTFAVLTFGSRSGTFTTLNGLNLGGGLELDPVYNGTDFTLVTQPA